MATPDLEVQLFRGEDLEPARRVALLPVVREALASFSGLDLAEAQLHIVFLPSPDAWRPVEAPLLYNLVPEIGHMFVVVSLRGKVLYQHVHPVHELIALPLREMLKAENLADSQWAFRIDAPGIPEKSAIRLAPHVEGLVEMRANEAPQSPGLKLSRVDHDPPPRALLADFGVTPSESDRLSRVKVLAPRSLARELQETRPVSDELEEGGFLIGRVFQDAEVEGAHLLKVTDASPAEHAGASALHFTLTADSYAALNRKLLETGSEDCILGWYHTHLFPATPTMGLSSIDVRLHFGTFIQPWHIAGLINLGSDSRTLRFYAREKNAMALCPYWLFDDDGD